MPITDIQALTRTIEHRFAFTNHHSSEVCQRCEVA